MIEIGITCERTNENHASATPSRPVVSRTPTWKLQMYDTAWLCALRLNIYITYQDPNRSRYNTATILASMEPSITPAKVVQPLTDFTTIGYNIYLWTSSFYTPKSPLILLFAWNAAAAKHIAKYTLSYQRLFPNSRILLVRCYTSDMFTHSAHYPALLTPALDMTHQHIEARGEVLVHSFSNGGGNQVNEFVKAWKGKYGSKLPMRAQIMDSSPTKGRWMRSHNAISAGLPRTWFWKWFGGLLVHVLLLGLFLVNAVRRKENKMVVLCREINDDNVFDKSVPRVYLYSRVDEMVGCEEVEEHAAIARGKGWDVTMVRFERSAHCGHVREDEGKYWGAILEAWKTGKDR
ncbi:hypothetical protein BU25DRAFT_131347 [Macroventuria anomochaeta]|uniref:Uncharacterized protein n=1 Tax=Macroventuria anomochaeta TaxID=301207 RepID=A0ACB6RUC5_9PLEO|nr:uncharacterized protein BU25DRAFT_131347 [Macroventuria anomochaeta]KAF2624653.1 hypothetical protein BU25DRAFT_131347 [Macroventuria anomochaeta]